MNDQKLSHSAAELAAMATALESSDQYRVLRRLTYRREFMPADGGPVKIGLLLDVETTGLDTTSDEVIELGMVKFAYLPTGKVTHVIDTYSSLHAPAKPIPEAVTKLTGITDEMVAGHRIDAAAVENFAADAAIVIAHNANFDRRFAERFWTIFVEKPWACSVNEVDWRALGFGGSRLGYLLAGIGLFHEGHRAVDDCRALLEILAYQPPGSGQTALGLLLERARRLQRRIWAQGSPFDLKDELKKRGYRECGRRWPSKSLVYRRC